MARENIDIVVREHGARVVRRNIELIGEAALPAARAIRILQNALFVVGGAGIVAQLQRVVDSLTQYENRLKLTSESIAQVESIQRRLFETANRSRTAFDAVSEIYSRTALSIKELGISQLETIRFTESLSKATILSGASAREARAALVQLAQGMASNRLSGDELRSVLEQLPYVADVIARSMKVTRGELRQMGMEGQISAEIILQAFREAREEIDERFANTVSTISQAVTILGNNFAQLVDRLDDFTRGSSGIASIIMLIANSLDELAVAALAVGTIFATKFLVGAVARIGRVVTAQIALKEAVASGNAVLLNSTEIELAKARSSQASASATLANTRATLANLQAERAMLSNMATSLQLQKEMLAYETINGRTRLVATGQFVNLAAAQQNYARTTAELNVVTARLTATEANLTQVQSARVAATNAMAGANARAAAAAVAANGVMARLARAAPAVAGLAAAFGRLVTFLGGPWVVAIGVVVSGLLLIETRTQRIERINQTLEDSILSVRDAYDRVGGVAKEVQDALEGITLVQALAQSEEAAAELSAQLNVVGGLLGALSQQNIGQEARMEFLALSQSVRTGEEDLGSILRRLDEIGEADESLRPLIERIQENIQTAGNLEDAYERLQAVVMVVGGTAEEAAEGLRLLGIGMNAANGETFADSFEGALESLREFVPALKEADKRRESLAKINAAYEAGLEALTQQEKAGEIRTLEVVSALKYLNDTRAAAIAQLTGVTDATKRATDALAEYGAETSLRALGDRERDLEREKRAFDELVATLRKAPNAVENVAAAFALYQHRVKIVNDEHDKVEFDRIARDAEAAAVALGRYISDTNLQGLEGRAEALERERIGFEELLGTLEGHENQFMAVAQATQAYYERLRLINERFDEMDSKEFTFGTAIEDLEQEISLLRLSADEREVVTTILAIEDDLRRKLTTTMGGEREQIERLIRNLQDQRKANEEANEELREEEALLAQLQGPMATLQDDVATLTRLLDSGKISIQQFNTALYDMEVAADVAGQSLRTLQMMVPDLARMVQQQDQIRTANRAFQEGMADIQEQREAGIITGLDQVGMEQQLRDTLRQAISEIDGTAQATRDATEARKQYNQETSIQLLDDRAAAIERERRQMEATLETLRRAGDIEGIGEVEAGFAARVAQINKEFDEAEAKRAARGGKSKKDQFTFQEGLNQIQQEIDLLKLSNEERRVQEGLLALESRLRRDLTAAETDQATAMLISLENAERAKAAREEMYQREIDLLNEIHGPRLDLIETQQTLNRLYNEGTITLDEYLRKLAELNEKHLEFDETLRGGFAQSINDAIMSAKEFGSALGDITVNAIGKLTDAILNFAETGKFAFRDFVRGIINELFKLAAQQLLLQILGAITGVPIMGPGGGAAFGGVGSLFGGAAQAALPAFAGGGSIMPSGSGTQDTQIVTFRKRPDERVDILTPQQQRADRGNGVSQANSAAPGSMDERLKIVNVLDPSIVGQYFKTAEGERLIVNIMNRNNGA